MNKIDRTIWLVESFSSKKPHPSWSCPICKIGILKGNKHTINNEHSQDTIKGRRSHGYVGKGEASFRFAGFMVCMNNKCNEKIAIIGDGKLLGKLSNSPTSSSFKGERYGEYFPKFFEPPLNIFPIYNSCPREIQDQIKLSFTHYFSDSSASANSIRTALELILNDKKIKKTTINSNRKRVNIPLHSRINILGIKHPELKPFLIAAKWIGNAGSHVGNISKEDLLDGYELLQHCIDELYDKPFRMKELSTKAKSINKRKKPLSNKKTK